MERERQRFIALGTGERSLSDARSLLCGSVPQTEDSPDGRQAGTVPSGPTRPSSSGLLPLKSP